MKQHPSIAIIGVSGYAQLIYHALQRVLRDSLGTLVAATVINPQEETETCQQLQDCGCRIFSDYREMLCEFHGKIDLCIIPTSIHWHAPMALDGMAAGAHVFIEKPLAGNLADSDAIIATAQKLGKTVAVGFQDMYSPDIWDMKRLLLGGEIGRVQSIQIAGSWPRDEAYYTRNNWAGRTHCDNRAVYDSPLNNAFAHFLNVGLFFAANELHDFARITSITGQLLRFFPLETYDTAAVRFRTIEGIPMSCLLTHADSESYAAHVTVHTTAGVLTWNHTTRDSVARNTQGRDIRRWTLDQSKCPREAMLRQVITAITSNKPVQCSATLARHHVEAIARINASLPITDGASDPRFARKSTSWQSVPGLFCQLTRSQTSLLRNEVA